jgi:branched-chain amino acid transport system ATP-binding protein
MNKSWSASVAEATIDLPIGLDGAATRPLVPTERQLAVGDRAVDGAVVHVGGRRVEVPGTTPGAIPTGEELEVLEAEAEQRKPRRMRAALASVSLSGLKAPRVPLAVFCLTAMFSNWDEQALALVAPELRAEFGLSISSLLLFSNVTQYAGLLLAIPIGALTDRVKRVWLVRIGNLAHPIAVIGQAISGSAGGLFAARGVGAAGGIVSGPASFALPADYFVPEERARVFNVIAALGKLGGLLSIPIVAVMVTVYGWRLAVMTLAIPGALVGIGSFFLREPVRGLADRQSMGLSEEEVATTVKPPAIGAALRTAWAVRTVRRQAFANLATGCALGPVSLVLTIYAAQRFQLSPFQRSMIAEGQLLLSIPLLLASGPLVDRIMAVRPARAVIAQGSAAMFGAFCVVAIPYSPNVAFFVVLTLLNAAVSALLAPAGFILTGLLIPPSIRGIGMQINTPFTLVGLLLSPALIKLSSSNDPGHALTLFGPVLLLGAILTFSSAGTVDRDMRAARAAVLAEVHSRESKLAGISKMLVCRDVDVAYDGVQVLFGVDFDMDEGETVALLGTNGAGKSTLLRAIAGLQPASNGAIYLDGTDITYAAAHQNARDGIVMMPGGHAVFPSLTIEENLRTAAWMYRKDEAYVAERLELVLGFFPQLRDKLGQTAGTLSGGEQQMVAMSQAFLMRPRLLLIDELSLGLAPAVVDLLLSILREIRSHGTTIVLVEQSLNVALTIADRAVFMEKGEILYDGDTEGLLARPDLVRAVFMGSVATGGKSVRRKVQELETALDVRGLSVAFGGVTAVNDVSFEVTSGEVLGIIGPNGAGKTTLFDLISGFTRADAGTVLVGGADVTGLSPDARARVGVGRSFQSARLFPALTVREAIAVAYERRAAKSWIGAALWSPTVRRKEAQLQRRIDGLIELLGLEAYADKFVRELSTGTRRAVDIACIMASEPKVLLLDEPSSGLAQAESEALGPSLLRLVRDTGCALVLIEHDMPLITSVSDRMLALDLGSVLATGTPQEVCSSPAVLSSYLSASADALERSGSRVGVAIAALERSAHSPADAGGSS